MASTTCHALLKALRTKLHACALHWRNHFFPAWSSSSFLAVLLVIVFLFSTAFSRVVVFFLPLVVSTSICCAAVYLFVASERGAAKEVVLICGEKAEVGLLQVFDGANASVYGDRCDVLVGCFLHRSGGGWTKRGVAEDGEDVVFAGRLAAAAGGGCGQDGAALEEELVALQVDRLAEGVWDNYFGGCSRWNHVTAGCDVEIEEHLS